MINRAHEFRSRVQQVVGRVEKDPGLRSAQEALMVEVSTVQDLRCCPKVMTRIFWRFLQKCVCYNNILTFATLSSTQFTNTERVTL